MKITANRGKQNKIHILCDGEYSFTVDAEYWFSSPYKSVENIDDEAELAAFLEAVGSRCAFLAGLRLLSYHDQSKRELVGKLVRKGHKSEYALLAADRLEELGYIDDERYARTYIAYRMDTKSRQKDRESELPSFHYHKIFDGKLKSSVLERLWLAIVPPQALFGIY